MNSAPINVRRFERAFTSVNPSRSIHNNPVTSHFFNAFSLLFPEGERFFIRNVLAFADAVEDENLRRDIRGFVRQESLHGNAHERMNANLEAHGFDSNLILKTQNLIFRLFEEYGSRFFDPRFGLAITIALEHFGSVWGEWVLDNPEYVEGCDDPARNLILYHSIEEIEHKHVAFDVYKAAQGSEGLRLLGLAVSVGAMWGGGLLGAANLLYQDKSISFRDFAFGLIDISRRNFSLGIHLTKETLDYLSPDFHPRNKNTYKLAEEATQALQLKDD